LGKPNQFGNMVKLQEAENQIVIDYEVYGRRPSDADLLIPPSKHTRPSWDVPRAWSRRTPPSIPPKTTRRRRRWASSACAFPIAPAKAPSANASRRSAGSAMGKNGGPDARGASAWSSGDTVSIAAATKASTE